MSVISRIATLTLLLCSASVFAESSVWRVSKNGNEVYVAGTIHLLKQSDYPLPDEFEQAYQKSQHLVFEIDASNAQAAVMAQPNIMQKIMYTDGRTLKTVLSKETYAELEAVAKANNLPLMMMNSMKPALVATQLTVMELQKIGMSATAGVDLHFVGRATSDGKVKSYLETIEQQIDLLANLGDGFEDEFVKYTLRDLARMPEIMDSMVRAWRSGDTNQIDEFMVESFGNDFPEIYEQMLLNRNKAWVPQIEQFFEDEKVEYVLVGAAHLAGKDSVLKMLEKKGYKVQQL